MTVKCPTTGMGCTEHCPDAHFCAGQQARRITADPWAAVPRKDYVWTILWRYSDNSSFGVLNVAFRKKEDAEDMLALLDEHSDSKHFSICQSVLKY